MAILFSLLLIITIAISLWITNQLFPQASMTDESAEFRHKDSHD